jgi:hypothetical protein
VRRTLGELVRRGPGTGAGATAAGTATPGFDTERADAVLPVVRLLLGLDDMEENTDDNLAGVTG